MVSKIKVPFGSYGTLSFFSYGTLSFLAGQARAKIEFDKTM